MAIVLRAARWQRAAAALLAATLGPWLLLGLRLGTGRLDEAGITALAVATPIAVVAVAAATNGFETQRLRTAGPTWQTAIVAVEGLGLFTPAWLVIGTWAGAELADLAAILGIVLAALAVGGALLAAVRRDAA
jgi:hypothetical protein